MRLGLIQRLATGVDLPSQGRDIVQEFSEVFAILDEGLDQIAVLE
jgi:hypothetical protein